MRSLICSVAVALVLPGCGESFEPSASRESELGQIPAAALAALDLPGCEALPRAATTGGRWRIAAHPADSRLAVLTRGDSAVCIDTPARAREELARLYQAAGLEAPALISTPIDDDPVPIRGEEGQGEDPGDGQDGGDSQPPRQGDGATNPQLAGSPLPSDDPVPIRGFEGHLHLIGTAASSTK
jgi:hypothetical protein